MIKLLKAKKQYKPKNGDLICEWIAPDALPYLETVPGKKQEGMQMPEGQILNIRLLHPNPWRALEQWGIDAKEIKAPYKCPYSGYEFFAIIPTAIISSDLEGKYSHVHHHNREFLFDYKWHKEMHGDNLLKMGEIEDIMLGSGWTSGTGVNDGSRSVIPVFINLDNGDQLLAFTWEWYNK